MDMDAVLKRVVLDFFEQFKIPVTLAFNIILVIIITVSLTQLFSSKCEVIEPEVYISEASVYCTPFTPVDRVIIDVDLDTNSHCYSSKSCVYLGHTLGEQQYNFIIGAYGFVYVQLGYQCKLEHQGVPTLKIRLPVDSIYNGDDFMAARKAVEKFTEILREGLECGLILHNYTLAAEGCHKWNAWCTRVLQEIVTDDTPGGIPGPKREFYVKNVQNTMFNPLDISRVYNYQYQLRVCGHRWIWELFITGLFKSKNKDLFINMCVLRRKAPLKNNQGQ